MEEIGFQIQIFVLIGAVIWSTVCWIRIKSHKSDMYDYYKREERHLSLLSKDLSKKRTQLEKKELDLQEAEKQLQSRIDSHESFLERQKKQEIQSILQKAASRSYFKDVTVYAEMCNSNLFENERFHKATSEKMTIVSPILVSAKIITGEHTYTTTLDSCTCPDYVNRHIPCKHMFRLAIDLGILSSFSESEFLSLYEERLSNYNREKQRWEKASKKYRKMLSQIDELREWSFDHSSEFLAKLFAEYLDLMDDVYTKRLLTKRNPAQKASERITILREEKKEALSQVKILEYQIALYESLFPWLIEYKTITPQEAEQIVELQSEKDGNTEQSEYDTLNRWLSPDEYESLPSAEKYQLALDRYLSRSKSNWEIGIEYERYVGYLYEMDGYTVNYSGALLKLEDMGRDLIAQKGNTILVIQCKRWAKEKIIHEKHIFQLYGTSILLQKQHPQCTITPVFCTTTELSEAAKYCAEKMGVVLRENLVFEDYPCVKCNIGRDGEKIYHLPFDQQYDRMNMLRGKKIYVRSATEAESLGFRHAYRWHSNQE